MTYYAKPDETYEQHIDACFGVWQETMSALMPSLEQQALRFNFPVERFKQGSLLSVAFHDIGKLSDEFQEMMLCKRENRSFDFSKNYRHELVSCSVMFPYWSSLEDQSHLSRLPVELLAVMAHHKQVDAELSMFDKERMLQMPQLSPEAVQFGIAVAEKLFRQAGEMLPIPSQINGSIDTLSFFTRFFSMSGLLNKSINYEGEGVERTRFLYSSLCGILHTSDWCGSAHVHADYFPTIQHEDVERSLVARCEEKGLQYAGFRQSQENFEHTVGSLIAVAPTGSGKTEAALLWAAKNIGQNRKIIYLLPTMATANAIWKRLCDVAGKEHVGLVHSTATLVREETNAESAEGNWADELFDESFMKPITVATVDQFLAIGFNTNRWTLKEMNAENSVVIVDEVHAYDGWTLGLLIASIRHFQQFGVRFLIMTATMSSNLRALFDRELEKPAFISDETFFQTKRSRYFVRDSQLMDALPEIEAAVRAGHRVIVAANTVRYCQEIARKLKPLNPVCYHSMFISKDKQAREALLDTAQLIVTTQGIEVSLDLDYDWLFTEAAPVDGVIQRGGRVNRYRDPHRDSRVFIHRYSDAAQKKVYNAINDPTLLERSWKVFKTIAQGAELSEADLMNLVESVYKDYHVEETQAFKDAIDEYQISQKNHGAILDNRNKTNKEVTRQIRYATMTVIPEVFKQQFFQARTASERRGYEVKVPLWYARKNLHPVDDIPFCAVDYDPDYGVCLSEPPPVGLEI
jgi:CRISPR-associated endonuclease/helicase Cas3